MKISICLVLIFFYTITSLHAQRVRNDSTAVFHAKELILPGALIGVGVLSMAFPRQVNCDRLLRDCIQSHHPKGVSFDDYTQYVPMASVYALNLMGVKGEHRFGERTIILTTAFLAMSIMVGALKYTTGVERPDGTKRNSFPSGHTATAFMGAEFLRMEYRNSSPWIAVAGYGVATITGCARMYNDRHWFSDVAVGAGIGILSTRLAYWISPVTTRILPRNSRTHFSLAPMYNGKQSGVALCAQF